MELVERMSVSPTTGHSPHSRALAALWLLAVLVAGGNALAVVRRLPILRQQIYFVGDQGSDEQTAERVAARLRGLPSNVRLLLLVSQRDISPLWFKYRLGYLIYPVRFDTAWESMPRDAGARYDWVLTFRSAGSRVPYGWQVQENYLSGTLWGRPGALPLPAGLSLPRRAGLSGTVAGVASVLVILILGRLLLDRTMQKPAFRYAWANLALAHLVGSAALSWLLLSCGLVAGRLLVWPGYLLLATLLVGRRLAPPAARTPVAGSADSLGSRRESYSFPPFVGRIALVVVCLGVGTALMRLGLLGLDWDGFAIWQFKAKAFFFDQDFRVLRDSAHFNYHHADYPLLTPIQTWWTYRHVGAVDERWPQLLGMIFYFDLLALFAAFVLERACRVYALLGLGILASLPVVTAHASSGFADVAAAAYLLGLGIALASLSTRPDPPARAMAVWMFAGAVMVKNEGALAAISGLLTLCVLALRGRVADVRRSLPLCAGASALAALPWWIARRAWGLTNDLFDPGTRFPITPGLLAHRFPIAMSGFFQQIARIGPYYPCWGLLILLLPPALIRGVRRHAATVQPLVLLGTLQFAGYVGIYLITPQSITGHMASSADRLVLHLAPLLLAAAAIGSASAGTESGSDKGESDKGGSDKGGSEIGYETRKETGNEI